MKNNIQLVAALGLALVLVWACVQESGAQSPVIAARTFEVHQSGGNCVYIVAGKYASFISVVPVGPGGC